MPENQRLRGFRIISTLLLLAALLLVMTSCQNPVNDLSEATVLRLERFTVNESDPNDLPLSAVIEDPSDILAVAENLHSLLLQRMSYNKPTAKRYSLTFLTAEGVVIEEIEISAHLWIRCDGAFHSIKSGTLDVELLDRLLAES